VTPALWSDYRRHREAQRSAWRLAELAEAVGGAVCVVAAALAMGVV
jgi:hypothetical protein